MQKNALFTGIVLISSAGILWGAMGTAVQYLFTLGGFTPITLVGARLFAAGLFFIGAVSLVRPKMLWSVWKDPRDMRDLMINGALLLGAHETFFESIYYSNAGTAAIMLTLVPLLAGVWYAVRHGRAVSVREIICFLLAAAGVALIITDGDFSELKFSPLAVAWGLLSTLFATVYSIQPVAVIGRRGVLPVVAWGIFFAGVYATVIAPPWSSGIVWSAASAAAFAFIVLFGTVAAFWAYLAGLKYVSPVIAGLLNCFEPLFAIFFSMLLLGDTMGLWQALGVVLVLLNVVLVALGKRAS